jgi:hypothetical protein
MNLLLAVGQAGVTLALPHGWSPIPLVLPPPGGGDPVTRIVVASSPIKFGQCNDISYRFSPTGVAIIVLEYRRRTPGVFPSRLHLTISRRTRIECHDGGGGSATFTRHGRRFAVFVLLGKRAPEHLVAQAQAVLRTLRVR